MTKLLWPSFAPDPDTTVPVDVADSWLVDHGRSRGLDLHRRRFTGSCSDPVQAAAFFDEAVARIPDTGRWFPRVEFHQGRFRLWIRPAPAPSSSVVLWTPDHPDPRHHPAVKGPDLARLMQLRAQAAAAGASEAVLVSPEGWVREGALSALMWWRGPVLCAPPEGPGLLPSVTRTLVLRIAERWGQEVRFEQVRPQSLTGLECWSLSALHGIRVTPGGRRAGPWQAELLGLGQA